MTTDLDLCRAFLDAHPGDAALLLEQLPSGEVAALLDALPPETVALAFDRMTPTAGAECLARMEAGAAATLVAALRTDLAAALLRRLDAPAQTALLDGLPGGDAGFLRTVLRYPEGTAGALMDPRVLAVAEDVTAGAALTRVRRSARHMLYYLYVVDREQRLAGVVDIGELMLARPSEPLEGIMHRSVARLSARMSRAAVLAHPGWRHHHALPVVDEQSALLGAIRYHTFRRLEDEAGSRARVADSGSAVVALGELYWLALSGLLDGIASAVKRVPQRPGAAGENQHAV